MTTPFQSLRARVFAFDSARSLIHLLLTTARRMRRAGMLTAGLRQFSLPARWPCGAAVFPVALALILAGCAGPTALPADADTIGYADTTSRSGLVHRLDHDGREREYLLHLPVSIAPQERLPLLISLHDAGADAAVHRRQTGFDALADVSRFAVAYPQAWRAKPTRPAAWVPGECCREKDKEGIDDVAFIRAVVEDIAAKAPVDRRRIYVVGIGNGAALAHRVAQALPMLVAAVAAVAGTPAQVDFNVTAPVPLLQIHSADDPEAPYGGGDTTLPGWREKVPQAGVAKTLRRWVQANRCASHPEVRRDLFGALGTVTAGQRASFYYHPECENQKEVALWRLDGFGHAWPGGWDTDADGIPTKRVDIIDASLEIWLWLSRFQRDEV